MRCWIELNESALRHNYRTLKQLAGNSFFVPILKSNAYGHGLQEVYSILSAENPDWLGVNYLFEAEKLRQWGFQGRILLVGPAHERELADAVRLKTEIFIANQHMLNAWLRSPEKPWIHVKFDTGMSRQGFLVTEADTVAKSLSTYKELVKGLCSHFANVEDVLEHKYAFQQVDKFKQAAAVFKQQGYSLLHHIASSASTLILKESLFDLVRVGISLYGVWPSQKTRLSYMQVFGNLTELRPVLSWKTEVAALKSVNSGQFIGYGCTYRAVHDMKIAVLPIGYYEGFPRLAGNKFSYVLINGQRCPIVGRVCMNMMMVDVSHITSIQVNDPVVVVGSDKEETLDASTVAEWADTIHYELLTRLPTEIPRRIIK